MEGMGSSLSTLFALCALSALAEALFDDDRMAAGVRAACGLSMALVIVRLAAGMLGA